MPKYYRRAYRRARRRYPWIAKRKPRYRRHPRAILVRAHTRRAPIRTAY